jgi:hypothetical protein
MSTPTTTLYDDWLDIRDARSTVTTTETTTSTAITDVNKAFDEIAGLFEVYRPPEPKAKSKSNRGKSLHLNTRSTKSK